MRAVVLTGGTVTVAERPTPTPAADQVLLRVVTAGCNRADLLQRDGRYPAPPGVPADIPGLEFAGEVVAVGPSVLHRRPGDRVMGITAGGAQAEYVMVRDDLCIPVPEGLELATAGALPEACSTAFEALVVQGGLRPGERVLVNAVGSGVGTALVQLGVALGAQVVGTTRSGEKLDRARALGLHGGLVIESDTDPESEVRQLREAAGGEIDLVVDLLGGDQLTRGASALRVGGRVVVLGFLRDARAELDVRSLIARRISITGTSLRGRPDHEKAQLAARIAREVSPLLASGAIVPVVDDILPLTEAARAYELLESNRTFGKVLLNASS